MPLTGRPVRLRVWQGAIAVVLGLGTLALVVDPGLHLGVSAPALDLVLDTTSAICALAVVIVGYVRSRELQDSAALYDGAALLVLAMANSAHVGVIVAGMARNVGLDPTTPSAWPLYAGAVVHLVAAVLLLAGCVPALRARRFPPLEGFAVLALPTVIVVLVCLGLGGVADRLAAPADLAPLAPAAVGSSSPVAGGPALASLNLLSVILLAIAAIIRPMSAGGAVPRVWLAVALTLAAFGNLHGLLYPSMYVGVVTGADLMQLAFYTTLFAGLQVARASELARAREADERRRRYHQTDVLAAAQSERLGLARELHDGVVQDLLALRHELDRATGEVEAIHRAAAVPVRRVAEAAGHALIDARRTIDHLRFGSVGATCLLEELTLRHRAFAERHGHSVEFRNDPSLSTVCGPRAREILRIFDEALANVQRHADATTVRVSANRAGDQLILTVIDNGRGFLTEHAHRGHGITGMHERAHLLGGRLAIHSALGEGTQVRLFAPITSANEQ